MPTTEPTTRDGRAGDRMRVPRSRGALSGFLLIILGLWGALIPFIGPYFTFAYTPDSALSWTMGRLWLEVLPGAVTVLGGFILLTTANRANAVLAGWLASAAGAWFVIGPVVSQLWAGPGGDAGMPTGGPKRQVVEQLGFFLGLGAVIIFLAAHAAGRVTVRSVRDLEVAERHRDVEGFEHPRDHEGFEHPRDHEGFEHPRDADLPRTPKERGGRGGETAGATAASEDEGREDRSGGSQRV